jgi:diacylglycerol O-acyltransferase / wax synthase
MTKGRDSDRLSWGDALFLYLEREGMPLNIASVSVLEGDIPLNECTRSISSKMSLLPRYSQRVVSPPWNVGFPTWELDPGFKLSNHIREVTLKRGTEEELKTLAGRILSMVMDRERPLWDFTIVHGLRNHRSAVILRMHHCLADGIAGVGLMNVLMDSSPEPCRLPPLKKPRRNSHPRNRRQQGSWTRLLDGWLSNNSDNIQRILAAQSDLLDISERIASEGDLPAGKIARFLPELTAPTQRLFFNVTYQGPQKFAWAQVPVSDIKAIRDWCGGTHNDVVLALMTATIRRYAELHGEHVQGRLLRLMVPVNSRRDDRPGELGNRISLLPVTVPLGIRSPRRLLAAVHDRTEFLKRSNVAQIVGLAGGLIGLVPTSLQALVGPLASLLPITPFNLVCTNIKGPQSPLYLLGHKMLDWYPYVPVGGEMALNCAILSYNGVTYFGFSGDVHAAPDLGRLEALLRLSFAELRQAAGLPSAPRRKVVSPQTAPPPQHQSRRRSPASPASRGSESAQARRPSPTATVPLPVAAD